MQRITMFGEEVKKLELLLIWWQYECNMVQLWRKVAVIQSCEVVISSTCSTLKYTPKGNASMWSHSYCIYNELLILYTKSRSQKQWSKPVDQALRKLEYRMAWAQVFKNSLSNTVIPFLQSVFSRGLVK